MKFGLGLSVQHSPDDSQAGRFQEHLEQVRLASAVGFDSVWASQHYLSAPFTYFQPIPLLAKVAADAGRMSLGAGAAPHGVVIGPDGAPWVTEGGHNAIVRQILGRQGEVWAPESGTNRLVVYRVK